MSTINIERHTIELSNEGKLLFPETKITKGNLITYYESLAPYMVPLITNHPIAMQRFPDGITHEGFYQKEIGEYFPDWVERKTITHTHSEHKTTYVVCNNTATAVYLANQAVITLHHWLSTIDDLVHPDRMIFDLDPLNVTWTELTKTALILKKVLEEYKLKPFVMTTGSRGLHVTVPLKQKLTFKKVRLFAQHIAQQVVEKHPALVTLEIRKEKRKNKIFIDTLRNQWAQHAVVPYSVRAIEGAPVATPLFWHELENKKLHAQYFTITNVLKKVIRDGNPWQNFNKNARALD
jgi:bifunctional non-homologous end joining protein LigD